jgi:hypothetical protein
MNLKWQAEFIAGLRRNGHDEIAAVLTRRFLNQKGDWRNPDEPADQERVEILGEALND